MSISKTSRIVLLIIAFSIAFTIGFVWWIKSLLAFECQVVIENQTGCILDSLDYRYLEDEGTLSLEPYAISDTLHLAGQWPLSPILVMVPNLPQLHLGVSVYTCDGELLTSNRGIAGRVEQRGVNHFVIRPGYNGPFEYDRHSPD